MKIKFKKKTKFKKNKFLFIAVLALSGQVIATSAAAVNEDGTNSVSAFIAGEHYKVLEHPVETKDADKIEVVELFSYACIHCYSFEPKLNAWTAALDDGVLFRRVPAIFNQVWSLLAQAYYTAETLDVAEKMHLPLFEAIHERGVDLRNPELMSALFVEHGGVEAEQFHQVFNSFSVRGRVQQADAHGRAYKLTGVPTLVVDGTYSVDGRMAGDNTGMLAVVDFLIAKISSERATTKKIAAEQTAAEQSGAETAQAD